MICHYMIAFMNMTDKVKYDSNMNDSKSKSKGYAQDAYMIRKWKEAYEMHKWETYVCDAYMNSIHMRYMYIYVWKEMIKMHVDAMRI